MENWRAVRGFPAYEVSDQGVVRAVATGRPLRPASAGGRPSVWLYRDRRRAVRAVARLVLETFRRAGRPLEVPVHLDGDHRNCRLANLRWGTRRAAWRAAPRRKSRPVSDYNRRMILVMRQSGCSLAMIARQYKVSRTAVWKIVNKKEVA